MSEQHGKPESGTRRSVLQAGLAALTGTKAFGQAGKSGAAEPQRKGPPYPAGLGETRTESFLGNLAPIMGSIQKETGFGMDYWHRNGMPVEQWREKGRAVVQRTLSYAPNHTPLDLKVHSVVRRSGYEIRVVSFAGSRHYRVPAFLLVPTGGKVPYPAIVALHDHGGWFYHGKEKLVHMDDEHASLKGFRDHYYGGRAFADELAKRGFVVLVPDAIYWGERRLQYKQPPPEMQKAVAGLRPEQVEYVEAMNAFLRDQVGEFNTWLGFCGTSWLGIVNFDDRASVDVLSGLPEVDAKRIGCLGLSGGGYRSTYLTGMEPRIRASVIVGWMTSLPTTLEITHAVHVGLFDAFGLHAHLDHPDVASLAAPACSIFVQDCGQDKLFTHGGMQAAADKIRSVYTDLKRPERFQSKFYDVPHQFNIKMQGEAFAWLERWLRA